MYSVASCNTNIAHAAQNTGLLAADDAAVMWEFLLACAASPFTHEHLRRIKELAERELDWPALLGAAQMHGLLPILQERLAENAHLVPDDVRRVIGTKFEQNARQSLWLTQLLLNVCQAFQRHGIEALPYKGPVLAQLLYGNVALRHYSDLDILVRAADVPRAAVVLREADFTPALNLPRRQAHAYLAAGYEFTFHKRNILNILELQWRILPRFYAVEFDTAEFFARCQKLEIADKSVATLGNEDLMLVLCAHAAKHAWCKLSWIRDVAELSQLQTLDWNQIAAQADRLGIRRVVAVTFRLAHQILSTPVPRAVQRFIDTDSAIDRIAGGLYRSLESGTEPDLESLVYFRFMSELRERRMDRLRFWWRLAATPGVGEWSLVQLPRTLFPLYRGLRLARLGARFIRGR